METIIKKSLLGTNRTEKNDLKVAPSMFKSCWYNVESKVDM